MRRNWCDVTAAACFLLICWCMICRPMVSWTWWWRQRRARLSAVKNHKIHQIITLGTNHIIFISSCFLHLMLLASSPPLVNAKDDPVLHVLQQNETENQKQDIKKKIVIDRKWRKQYLAQKCGCLRGQKWEFLHGPLSFDAMGIIPLVENVGFLSPNNKSTWWTNVLVFAYMFPVTRAISCRESAVLEMIPAAFAEKILLLFAITLTKQNHKIY